MKLSKTYKYKKDGIVYIGGKLPEDAEVLETMDILCAEENMTLIRIEDNKDVGSSIWLREGDKEENYKEEEIKDDDTE